MVEPAALSLNGFDTSNMNNRIWIVIVHQSLISIREQHTESSGNILQYYPKVSLEKYFNL